ncbi:retrotransposon protein [Striga asiatica]|uniref:Retrotransposon protein n=1 Tax=Striga asiatica TaxID=4170 RepID=A0A5A7RGT4_STRAF|nr:retrotransposon protein [Striga asiatica]
MIDTTNLYQVPVTALLTANQDISDMILVDFTAKEAAQDLQMSQHKPLLRKTWKRAAKTEARDTGKSNSNIPSDQQEIERIINDYYTNLYTSQGSTQGHTLLPYIPNSVTDSMNEELIAPVSEEDIKKALFTMNPHKSPGEDGMSALFYQHFWPLIKGDICRAENASWLWNSWLKVRDKCGKWMQAVIHNGKGTRILDDFWVPNSKGKRLQFIPGAGANLTWTAAAAALSAALSSAAAAALSSAAVGPFRLVRPIFRT